MIWWFCDCRSWSQTWRSKMNCLFGFGVRCSREEEMKADWMRRFCCINAVLTPTEVEDFWLIWYAETIVTILPCFPLNDIYDQWPSPNRSWAVDITLGVQWSITAVKVPPGWYELVKSSSIWENDRVEKFHVLWNQCLALKDGDLDQLRLVSTRDNAPTQREWHLAWLYWKS